MPQMHPWPASSRTPERNRCVTAIRSQHPSAVQLQEPPEPAQSPGSLSGLELDCSDEPHTQLRLRYQNHRGGRSYWEVSAEHQTKTNEISIIVHFQFACFNRPVSNQTIWSHQGPRAPTSRRYRCSEHRLHYTDSIWTLLYTVLI